MSDGDAGNHDREPVPLLVFSASLRDGSLNTKLAELAATNRRSRGRHRGPGLDAGSRLPSYNADDQEGQALTLPVSTPGRL